MKIEQAYKIDYQQRKHGFRFKIHKHFTKTINLVVSEFVIFY